METTTPEAVGFSSKRLGRIGTAMQRYVDEGKFAGTLALVARKGKVAYFEKTGWKNMATNQPMELDTIFRIYSMTKPITSVAALMLMEEGCLRLDDPVTRYIPEWKDLKVSTDPIHDARNGTDMDSPMLVRHLFTHTAGLSYGFNEGESLDELYRKHFWSRMDLPGANLKDMVEALGTLPLAHQPGTAWRYSLAIDVLGYLVEVISGVRFDEYLRQRIFEPLGMLDTAFWVPPEKASRFAVNYGPDPDNPGKLVDIDPFHKSHYLSPRAFHSGGGGLVSTTQDYLRFCQMLLNGGELDGTRLLGRKTVERMRINHLPVDVYEDANRANGFGLGGNVLVHPERSPALGSPGIWGWGGAANTKFWIDFQEEIIGILMLQYMPSFTIPIEIDFQNLVYQALID